MIIRILMIYIGLFLFGSLIFYVLQKIMSFGFLENKTFNNNASNFYMFSMVLALTFTVILSLRSFRKQIQFYYFYYYHAPNKDKPFNFLKIRSILLHDVSHPSSQYFNLLNICYVQIINFQTNKISDDSEYIKTRFKKGLQKHKIYGKLLDLKLIPDYSAILDCTRDLIELEGSKQINTYSTKVNWVARLFMPGSYFSDNKFRKQQRKLKEKINNIKVNRKEKSSGYGFACFDHFETISKLKKFERKYKSEDWWKCWQTKNKNRMLPYFQLFVNSVDINWMNCYADKKIHFIRTFILQIFVVLILIFLSTPTVIIQIFKKTQLIESLGYYKLQKYLETNQFIAFILQTYLPPMIILLINKVNPNLQYLQILTNLAEFVYYSF